MTSTAYNSRVPMLLILVLVLVINPTPALGISTETLFTAVGETAGELFGGAVAIVGDVDGDGYPDVIVGSLFYLGDRGRAYLFLGGPGADAVPDLVFSQDIVGEEFGSAVARAGDVNGDGFADILIGAPGNRINGTDAGAAYVYFGGAILDSVPDLTILGVFANSRLGNAVSGAGDVNGDGYDDIIVGAAADDQTASNAGRAYLFHGGMAPDTVPDLELTGFSMNDFLGTSVGSADINADGFSDLIVGVPGSDLALADGGAVLIYYGGPGMDANHDVLLTGTLAGTFFGHAVAGAGDVNGDGFEDVLVGTPFDNLLGANTGRAFCFFGGAGMDATVDWYLSGDSSVEAFGTSVTAAGDLNGDGYGDVAIGAPLNTTGGSGAGRVYAYFGGPAADSAEDIILGGNPGDVFGASVGGGGDVDGDGFCDLVVGAWNADVVSTDDGKAVVITPFPYRLQSPNGGELWVPGQSATVSWTGHDVADLSYSTDGGASWSILAVGIGGSSSNTFTLTVPGTPTEFAKVRLTYTGHSPDQSNSETSDGVFMIKSPEDAASVAHRLQLSATGNPQDQLGVSASGAGDFNGDGHQDFVVGSGGYVHVYFGGTELDSVPNWVANGEAGNDAFGRACSGGGDVNGDGFDDIIVGAPFSEAGGEISGRVYVYFGAPMPDTVPGLVLTGTAFQQIGFSVSMGGDVNGDGFDDFIVGGLMEAVHVYLGGPALDATPDWIIAAPDSGALFGFALSMAGDVNGDGFFDILVGSQHNDVGGVNAGAAYLYLGGGSLGSQPDLAIFGENSGEIVGRSLLGGGDVNGDGFDDIFVGATGVVPGGEVRIYFGGPAPDNVPDWVLTATNAGDSFGLSISAAGDVNRDGFSDVIVGAPGNDAGGFNAGQAYVFLGGIAPDPLADLVVTGEVALGFLGSVVAGPGDLNGDGFDDFLVTAPNSFVGTGTFYLYDCFRYFMTSPNGGEVWNVGGTEIVSWEGAEPADIQLSIDGGATYTTLKSAVGGSELNTVPLQVPHLPTRFAKIRISPADPLISGENESDSLFTIEASVTLLSLKAEPGGGGLLLSWNTEPQVGPQGLSGYRLYRLNPGELGPGVRVGPQLITETTYADPDGIPGQSYRLIAVNGFDGELEVGRITFAIPFVGLRAWPSPVRAAGSLNIQFAIPLGSAGLPAADLEVTVFDVQGRRVADLARGQLVSESGILSITWDLQGRLNSGVYFVRAAAPSVGFAVNRKVVVVQ